MAASEKVRVRLGTDFLKVECSGDVGLTAAINTSTPGEEYSFDLCRVPDEDSADGDISGFQVVRLQASRCQGARIYYLCAGRDFNHPYSYKVSSHTSIGPGSLWIKIFLPAGKFVLESCLFRNYCLANNDGHISLERVSRARRSKHVIFYPVRHIRYHHRSRRSVASSTTSSSGVSEMSVSRRTVASLRASSSGASEMSVSRRTVASLRASSSGATEMYVSEISLYRGRISEVSSSEHSSRAPSFSSVSSDSSMADFSRLSVFHPSSLSL